MNYIHFSTFMFCLLNTVMVAFWFVAERPFLRTRLGVIDRKIAEFDAAIIHLHQYIVPRIDELERKQGL